MNAREILPARKRGPRLRRRAAAAILLAAFAAAGWWASLPFRAGAQSPSPSQAIGIHKLQGASWHPESGQILWIAIMGSDARSGPPDARGGCDAVHIMGVNPALKAGTILDFPRDSVFGGNKLTDICRTTGFDGALGLIKSATAIPVQYVVRTEFSHFRALIDELGGIDLTVPYDMHDEPFSGANLNAGAAHLDGAGALAFSRNRHATPNGDFSRTENQGTVILASLVKFRAETSDLHRIFDYVLAARRNVAISIPISDLVKMAFLAKDIDPANIRNLPIPGSTGNLGGKSVVVLSPGDIYDRVRDDAIY
jgi:polyisoprenyl-teichoic acid--peptidoglycan teichoic acid transferase